MWDYKNTWGKFLPWLSIKYLLLKVSEQFIGIQWTLLWWRCLHHQLGRPPLLCSKQHNDISPNISVERQQDYLIPVSGGVQYFKQESNRNIFIKLPTTWNSMGQWKYYVNNYAAHMFTLIIVQDYERKNLSPSNPVLLVSQKFNAVDSLVHANYFSSLDIKNVRITETLDKINS